MVMENNDFEGGFDARLSGIFMFFFGLPFACVPFFMAWLCYMTVEQYYYGWIDFSGLILQLVFFLLFMITFGFVGFGMMIGSFKMISWDDQETPVEENIGTPITDPIIDNEWWKS